MIRNYFKIAFRNMLNRKMMSFINVFCLAVGIVVFLSISAIVLHEISYDRHFKDSDRIYRLTMHARIGEEINANMAIAPGPAPEVLAINLPEVQYITRMANFGSFIIGSNQQKQKETKVLLADSNFFKVFDIPLIAGKQDEVLKSKNSTVITRATAERYFGDINPVGKVLEMGNMGEYTITGICENVPENTHFTFDFLNSLSFLNPDDIRSWVSGNSYPTYIKFKEGTDFDATKKKLSKIVDDYVVPELQHFGFDFKAITEQGGYFRFDLQPLADIHLSSPLEGELGTNVDTSYIYIISIVGIFILLLACINFMNLTTANASVRSKEIGVRKISGSGNWQLIWQFLVESILMTLLATVVGLAFTEIALVVINQVMNQSYEVPYFSEISFVLFLMLFIIILGILSGLYPAFYLSSLKPIKVLKGKFLGSRDGKVIRVVLVTLQFIITSVIISGALMVRNQLNYMLTKDPGYQKDQVLVIHDTYVLTDQVEVFRNKLLQYHEIANVAISSYTPIYSYENRGEGIFPENSPNSDEVIRTPFWGVGKGFFDTYGMKIMAGSGFTGKYENRSDVIVINQQLAKKMGWENPVGEIIRLVDDRANNYDNPLTVVGVVQDFHFESMKQPISTLVFQNDQTNGQISIRATGSDYSGLLQNIEKEWKSLTDQPFDYSFLDEQFEALYSNESRLSKLIDIFSIISILIACLGLYGLSVFTTEQKIKEVGIRKVLGASIAEVLRVFSKDFLKPVLIALVMAIPVSIWSINSWLHGFAYRVNIGFMAFVFSTLTILVFASATIAYQSIKTAMINPVDSLRNE